MAAVRVDSETTGSAGVLDPARVNVRHKIAALWASILFVFTCVHVATTVG